MECKVVEMLGKEFLEVLGYMEDDCLGKELSEEKEH